jgi:hypothetical protein
LSATNGNWAAERVTIVKAFDARRKLTTRWILSNERVESPSWIENTAAQGIADQWSKPAATGGKYVQGAAFRLNLINLHAHSPILQ